MRKLSYKALLNMNNEEVIVQDQEYDIFWQRCKVKLIETPILLKNGKVFYKKNIKIINEEYLFEFDDNGKCLNGEFLVFTKN